MYLKGISAAYISNHIAHAVAKSSLFRIHSCVPAQRIDALDYEMNVRDSESHQTDSYCVLLGYDIVECSRRLPTTLPFILKMNTRLITTSRLTLSYVTTQEDYTMNFHRPENLRSCFILLSESHEVGPDFGACYVDEECLKCNVKASRE
jgi:hypothetical protein